MGKKIIIDSDDVEVKTIKKEPIYNDINILKNNKFIEWIVYMFGYSIVLIIVSLLFKSFYINLDYFGIYAFIASIIIYILNKTVKPFLNALTLPINVLSMGLAYPIVNIIILRITSLILGFENFYIKGFIAPFFVVIFISFFNIMIEGLLIKPLVNTNSHE